MNMHRVFLALTGVVALGAGCFGDGNFTYTGSNAQPNLPPPVFESTAPTRTAPTGPMELRSAVFTEGGRIPEKYTCNGSDFSPPVEFVNVPLAAAGLALVMEDVDAPNGFIHWVLFNMPASVTSIAEGDVVPGALGTGSGDRQGYEGPCPPEGSHRYEFTLYAVRGVIDAEDGGATAEQVRAALEDQVVATATLTGTYGE